MESSWRLGRSEQFGGPSERNPRGRAEKNLRSWAEAGGPAQELSETTPARHTKSPSRAEGLEAVLENLHRDLLENLQEERLPRAAFAILREFGALNR